MAAENPKLEIVMVAPLMPEVVAQLEATYTVHKLWTATNRAAFLAEHGRNARALLTTGAHGADGAMLAALPRIEIIVSHGVGLDAIDLQAAATRKLPVTTTPGVLTADVADMAIALIFGLCRRIPEGDAMMRAGKWATGGKIPLGRRVSGKRAGIVGLGQIGSALAKRLRAFDVAVGYVDPFPRADTPAEYRRFETVAELARESDILIAAAAGSDQTRKIIGREVLDALGPKGIFVNVGRGMLVDEDALLDALEKGRIAGAALDVFNDEPNISPRFFTAPNTVLTPHQASATTETRRAMGQICIDNLAAHFAGKPLIGVINR